MVDFQPGFGSLPNHHCLLASLGEAPTSEYPPYSDALLYLDDDTTTTYMRRHGESPGTGAFSYSLGRDFYAKRDLQAGEEIVRVCCVCKHSEKGRFDIFPNPSISHFVRDGIPPTHFQFLNYGHCKRKIDGDVETWQQNMIYPEDVKEVSRILNLYHPFGSKPWPQDAYVTDGNITSAIRNLVSQESNNKDAYTNARPEHVTSILSKFWNGNVRQKLYDTVDEIYILPKHEVIHSLGSGASRKDSHHKIFQQKLRFEVAKMTLEPAGKSDPTWIKDHGQCLENLIPKKSTIPDAGFGGEFTRGLLGVGSIQIQCLQDMLSGFAQFPIRQGEMVVPAPVLHVINKETLMVYGWDVENPEDAKIGMSLLMNYCLSHPESTLLLCPMTSAILLNHCSGRTKDCGSAGPNAKIRWSTGWDTPSYQWRSKTEGTEGTEGEITIL
jgi:hypothetical protein